MTNRYITHVSRQIVARVPHDVYAAVTDLAKRRGVDVSAVVREALREELARETSQSPSSPP